MKKKFVSILLSTTMLLGAFSLSACTNSELEAKIAELEAQIEELEQEKLELENEIEQLETEINANVVLGTFYSFSLEEAYEKGLLTKDDLLSIAYYHNGGRAGNEELMPEDYVPQPQDFEALSEKAKDNICKAYLNYLNDPYYNKVIFLYYHGVYNGYTVVELLETNSGVLVDPLFLETYELDGVWFAFFNPEHVKFWVEEK